jgi:GNAT superfamily N-acetyltransferase
VVLVYPATARDVPALRALGVRTWRATYEGVLAGADVERGIEELFNTYWMLAAFRDGILVGLLEFDRVDATRTMVRKLYVDADARGRGIGGLLLERFLQVATTPEVRVEYDERNVVAGAFFAGFGFAVDEVVGAGGGARTVRSVRRLSPPGAPR